MNIGYLIKFKWYPPEGGAPGHAYQVANQLIKHGHHLHSIFYYNSAPNLKVYRQRQLFKFLQSIDVLYLRVDGDFGYEIFTLLKFLKFMKLPVIWEINSPLEELLMRGKTEEHVKRLHRKRAFLAKFVDAAICVSGTIQEYAKEKLRIKNAFVVPNGSDPSLFSPKKRDPALYKDIQGHFKLIWTGSAHYKWQGLDLINAIASRIYGLDKNITFILIGNRRDLADKEKWAANIRIFDQKGYLEIPSYIASTDAGLCLYHNRGLNGKFYFSPLKLFDYMASGLAIIATGIGQIKEVIKNQEEGILVDNDIDEIVKSILLLKNHPQEAKRMGLMARKKVEEFYNWTRVGEQTEQILQSLVEE